jgi:hypothetical protein
LAPSKCPSKWLKKLLSRKKKIMPRSFLNSGTLTVILVFVLAKIMEGPLSLYTYILHNNGMERWEEIA